MFARAVRIARIRGVEVRLDPSLLLLAVLLAWLLFRRFEPVNGQMIAVLMALAGSLLFFASILAHELGHAFEALRRGIGVKGVTLLLFGGVTEMHHESRSPRDEFAIAAIGPYLSLVCAATAHLLSVVVTRALDPAVAAPIAELALLLAYLNLLLAVFNLVPGAPLDGGRVLRAILWRLWGDRRRAVRGAARAGQTFAVAVLAFGVLEVAAGLEVAAIGGLWWVLIGIFLFRAATAELRRSEAQAVLAGRTAGDVAAGRGVAPDDGLVGSLVGDPDREGSAEVPRVSWSTPLEDVVPLFLGGARHVRVDDHTGRPVAVLTERQTADALRRFEREDRDAASWRRTTRDRTPA